MTTVGVQSAVFYIEHERFKTTNENLPGDMLFV